MKKIIFFVLLICLSFAVNAQSTKSLGLTASYSPNTKNLDWVDFQSPNISLVYNHFFNEKHGIVTELGLHQTQWSYGLILSSSILNSTITDYNSNLSLHYIFKPNQWFVKSGLNLQGFHLVRVEESNSISMFPDQVFTFEGENLVSFDKEQMNFLPEFHLALGRDFDLGKVNIRVSGFMKTPFLYNDYRYLYDAFLDFGLSAGVFYQFGK